MGQSLVHRGPDDSGLWVDVPNGIAITHQRLSILDLSPAGRQPMSSPSGRYVISFNGEIYNHLSLRRLLERRKLLTSPWIGTSDTETLLCCIEKLGLEETLNLSSGMFAFALWDSNEKRLFLVRDRFGEKPLYWGFPKRGDTFVFAFASDLAAIRAIPRVLLNDFNPQAITSYFHRGCISAPLSVYKSIHQLPPGHFLVLNSPVSQPQVQPWWDSCERALSCKPRNNLLSSPESAVDSLDAILRQVIQEQSLSDVPLGSFLSGGIDSSLVTSLLQAQSSTPVRSFTISFPDNPEFNEGPYAASIAQFLGTDHTDVPLTSLDALALIPHLPHLYSEPFADSSQLPTHLVCREARRSSLTVALTGDGGDELFGGYNRHRLLPSLHRRIGFLPSVLRSFISSLLETFPVSPHGLDLDKRQKLSLSIRNSGSLADLHNSVLSVWLDPTNDLLQPEWASPTPAHILPPSNNLSASEQLMLADLISYLPSDILVKLDRAAMSTSLETRAPMLDFRVAELAWQIPSNFKVARNGSTKWVLRQLLLRYLPINLFHRSKTGFSMPIGTWLRGPLRNWANDLLDTSTLSRQGILRPDTVQRVWNEHLTGRDHTSKLWSILMWQSWYSYWH